MIAWPDGKRFMFTISNDTDAATLANIKAISNDLLISASKDDEGELRAHRSRTRRSVG